MQRSIHMIGIGIDAVEVDRFRRIMARTPGVAFRVFTSGERAYGERFADPVPRLAARFAAKEAAMKALGVGIGAFAFKDLEVINAPSGAPALRVSGGAAALASERGVTAFHLSMTHTDRTAEAVVMAL